MLEGVTFEVLPGESVAIVGPTGVGKSTLTQLMVRLVDPDEGHVAIGGVDLRHVDVASLRAAAAVVFQESFLFAESVRANIALDSGADRARGRRAAVIAACDRFIRALPQGYETIVGERGLTLSGASANGSRSRGRSCGSPAADPGRRDQRGGPSIEAEILGALRRELATTLVVVAYRLSTIRLADRVIFLRGRSRRGDRLARGAARGAARIRLDHPRLRTGRAMSEGRDARRPRRAGTRTELPCPRSSRARSRCSAAGVRESPELRKGLGFTLVVSLGITVSPS